MLDEKQYYISSLSLKNRYRVREEFKNISAYERWISVSDEYNTEYVIVFERIGNYIPNVKKLLFELPIHKAVIYPMDLIKKYNMYTYENEIGYVYPASFLRFKEFDYLSNEINLKDKVKYLYQLTYTLEDIHRHNIYLNGFDRKQILTEADKILFRYNGFKNHNRNSIYKVPDFIANNYTSIPWIQDVFSLVAIIFECMYRWNPFCGMMSSFSDDEEYQFEVFYNNFSKKIFIFEKEKKLNQIGFLMNQRTVIEKWLKTDPLICDFFNNILTMDIPKNYTQEGTFEKIHKLLGYYYNSEIFQ